MFNKCFLKKSLLVQHLKIWQTYEQLKIKIFERSERKSMLVLAVGRCMQLIQSRRPVCQNGMVCRT